MYGLGHPGGHHLTSVALHAATAVLLFLVLLEMTAELWPSAFVAALFAVHPLHVESVAWVSERKDVLSGLFFVLTLAAYARYVRRPSIHRYLVVLGAFSLGLLSKPMVVTLPLVLLLLDYWPLRRLMTDTSGEEARFRTERTSQARRLVLEKIPLFVLGLATAAVTYLVQGTARQSMPELTLAARAGNALVSYVSYLGKFVYPVRLAVFYPHPGTALPLWQVRHSLARPRRDIGGRVCLGAAPAVSAGRVAVVPGNAGARDRPRAGWLPGDGGPVHVSAADRDLHDAWRGAPST